MTSTEFAPRVSVLGEVLVQLEDSPHIRLVVLLMFRVHRVQFARGARREEERAVEECCKTCKGAFEGRGSNVEVKVGVTCAGICVRSSVVLRKELQQGAFRLSAREACKRFEPQSIRSPEGTSPSPATILATSDFIQIKIYHEQQMLAKVS